MLYATYKLIGVVDELLQLGHKHKKLQVTLRLRNRLRRLDGRRMLTEEKHRVSCSGS